MQSNLKPQLLKFLIPAAGLLGFGLRKILYTTGIDGRGLLVRNHPAAIALWILTAAVAVVLLLFCLRLQGPELYKQSYPASFGGCIGCFAAAAGIVLTMWPEFARFPSPVDIVSRALGLAAAVAFLCVGICRLLRLKPYFLLQAVICIYLTLRMITRYRALSSEPQLMDYCFYLTAYVALMLASYHHAAFDASMGSHRALWIFSLGAVYLGCVSLSGAQDLPLFAGCALWALTNLTDLNPRKYRRRAAMEPLSPGEE